MTTTTIFLNLAEEVARLFTEACKVNDQLYNEDHLVATLARVSCLHQSIQPPSNTFPKNISNQVLIDGLADLKCAILREHNKLHPQNVVHFHDEGDFEEGQLCQCAG